MATKLLKGQMAITVLEDGTIKTETSDMAGPAHQAADNFLKMVATLAGGTVTDEKLEHGHHHHHGHSHSHSHGDEGEHHHH